MSKIGNVIERTPNGGEIRKGFNGLSVLRYYAWEKGATTATEYDTLAEARQALNHDPLNSAKASAIESAKYKAELDRKVYVSQRNANHKGR